MARADEPSDSTARAAASSPLSPRLRRTLPTPFSRRASWFGVESMMLSSCTSFAIALSGSALFLARLRAGVRASSSPSELLFS